MKKILTMIALLMSICLTLPIWLYLLYKMMVLVGATELMWFLFWIYVPATFAVSICTNALKSMANEG